MAAIKITADNFTEEVLNSDKPVLVDFWADWCGPCKMLSPVIEEIAEEVSDVKICKVNVDEEQELAAQYKVMSIPTLVLIKEGKTTKTALGVQSKDAILEMIKA